MAKSDLVPAKCAEFQAPGYRVTGAQKNLRGNAVQVGQQT